jgi:hypothetical protein
MLAFFALPGRPGTVAEKGTWLFSGKVERELILERTVAGIFLIPLSPYIHDVDNGAAKNEAQAKFQPRQISIAFKDIKTYLDALIVAAFGLGVTSFGLFLPTFIKEFGFSPCKCLGRFRPDFAY